MWNLHRTVMINSPGAMRNIIVTAPGHEHLLGRVVDGLAGADDG